MNPQIIDVQRNFRKTAKVQLYINIYIYTYMLTYKHRHKLKLHKTIAKCFVQGLFFDVGLVSLAAHLGRNMLLVCQSVFPCVNTSVEEVWDFVFCLLSGQVRKYIQAIRSQCDKRCNNLFYHDQSRHATADWLVNWLSLSGGKLTPFCSEINCI